MTQCVDDPEQPDRAMLAAALDSQPKIGVRREVLRDTGQLLGARLTSLINVLPANCRPVRKRFTPNWKRPGSGQPEPRVTDRIIPGQPTFKADTHAVVSQYRPGKAGILVENLFVCSSPTARNIFFRNAFTACRWAKEFREALVADKDGSTQRKRVTVRMVGPRQSHDCSRPKADRTRSERSQCHLPGERVGPTLPSRR